MKKRITAMLLALVLLLTLCLVPVSADTSTLGYGYDETAAESVTITVTISNDGMPIQGQDGTVLSALEVTVPYFDLKDYGLDNYYRYETTGGSGAYTGTTVIQRPTALHAYIYLLERYYMGRDAKDCGTGPEDGYNVLDYSDTIDVSYMDGTDAYNSGNYNALTLGSGGATHLYMTSFWGHDENLMYFRNHACPLMSEGTGATADYVLLSDNDTLDIAMFSNNDFWSSGSAFCRFDHEVYTVEAGGTVTATTKKTGVEAGAAETTMTGLTVAVYDSTWTKVDTLTGTEGSYSYQFNTAGTYYLVGIDQNAKSSSALYAPAIAKVTVSAAAWDGTTQTEPGKDSDGVYQIGTGAELAWFVNAYSADKKDVSGVLTADIDLNGKAWTTSTNYGKEFKLDGQNHTIKGLNATYGLLPKLSGTTSEIKNLTVCGNVSATKTYSMTGTWAYRAGGIVGYMGGGTIENCVSHVNITTTNTSTSVNLYIGGIVGQTYTSAGVIKNCANFGAVNVTGQYAGGVIGYMASGMKVTGCYNAGNITGTNYVGGLVGSHNSGVATIIGCYNTGNVSGSNNIGGLFGYATGQNDQNHSKVSDCYNVGTVTGNSKVNHLFGRTTNLVTTTNLFYLQGTTTDSKGTAQTMDELKALDLDHTYFKSVCGGYPALVWQTDVMAHTPSGSGDTTAPTCTEDGYTSYTCAVCSVGYKDWVKALGHNYCTHAASETCEHCSYELAPTQDATGTLKRQCQNLGCESVKEDEAPQLAKTYEVKLPTGQPGYNVKAVDGSKSPVEEGGSFSFKVTAKTNYEKSENFCVKVNDEEIKLDENGVYTITNIQENKTVKVTGMVKIPQISITVPRDATVELNYKVDSSGYYYQTLMTALDVAKTVENEDDTVTYYYTNKKNTGHTYRVTTDDGVTYVGFFKKTENVRVDLTVTKEQLHPTGKTAKTLDRNLSSNSGYNVGDVFLNINAKGYLTLKQGDTKQLYPLRNWQAIKDGSYMLNAFVEPDYHYTVLDENGQASNSVVTVDEKGLLTAVGDGTAIVLVTYDAMTYEFTDGDEFFGAIWPENTGVFVVSVGAGDSGITTGMTINTEEGKNFNGSNLAGDALDAEMDVIYFIGNSGSYTFTPGTEGVTVSVANPTVGDTMTFTGFRTVTANSDGSYSVPLVEGRNIVKLEKDGKAEYQVITAKKLTVTINNGETVKPGDAITITFSTIYHPANKLGAIYNGTAGVIYTTPDDDQVGSITGGGTGVYNIASNTSARTVTSYVIRNEATSNWGTLDITYSQGTTFTIPEDYTGSTYTLDDGAVIAVSNAYCMKFGAHRTINGVDTTTATQATLTGREAYFGQLPDIVIQIAQPWDDAVAAIKALPDTITLGDEAAVKAARAEYEELTDEQKPYVSNYDKLTAAEAALAKLAADKAAADAVIARIDVIGNVTLNSRDVIDAAREAYEALTTDQQALVTNYDVLTAAEARFAQLKRQTALIIGTAISRASEPKVEFPFTDVPENAWYYDEVKNAWENGLIDGMNAKEFQPEGTLTVAQAIKLAAALHQMDNDGKVTLKNGAVHWFDTYVEYAVENRIIEGKYAGYSLAQMNAPISRAEFVHIFHGAMSSYYACNTVADNAIPDVKSGDAYADEIYTFYRAGILTGSDGRGTFQPASSIKRCEVAAILIRMYDTNARQAITLG